MPPKVDQLAFFVSQTAKLDDQRCKAEAIGIGRVEDEEAGDCELSLSLSLLHPPSQRSNASSTSEISETFSSYSRSNFKDCSGSSSGKHNVNLDLSIALCGA